jgi:hypothetical protein
MRIPCPREELAGCIWAAMNLGGSAHAESRHAAFISVFSSAGQYRKGFAVRASRFGSLIKELTRINLVRKNTPSLFLYVRLARQFRLRCDKFIAKD